MNDECNDRMMALRIQMKNDIEKKAAEISLLTGINIDTSEDFGISPERPKNVLKENGYVTVKQIGKRM